MRRLLAASLLVLSIASPLLARSPEWVPFDALPRVDKVREAQRKANSLPRDGRLRGVRWSPDAPEVQYRQGDSWWAVGFDGSGPRKLDKAPEEPAAEPEGRPRRGGPARGRQWPTAASPDAKLLASYRDGNLYLSKPDGSEETAITTEGDGRLKFGSASWVYGEELDQTTAMWWSPDGTKLAFYRFDDRPVKDYILLRGLTKLRPSPVSEAYPKPGEPNPIAGLLIYDVASKKTTTVDVGPETNQYIYEVEWTPDSSGLLFRRTNRRQDRLDLMMADPATGASHAVLTETQPTWQANSPTFRFLKDGKRFLWETERSGFAQYELWSLEGKKLAELTHGDYPVDGIVKVDEERGTLWYQARSSGIKINPQLHRVGLDGTNQARVTPDDLHWSGFQIAPDGSHIVATSEFVDKTPETWLLKADGTKVMRLAASNETDPWRKAGLSKPDFVQFTAADGKTPIYGILYKPSDFDPAKKYPLVVEAYGGPAFALISTRMAAAKPNTEFGVLILTVDNRGTPGRGKAFEAANYLSLGEEDCDDQAAAVKELASRGYVDTDHVAITGHSYGGFMTLAAMLRYPDVFQVGVAGAPPTDWRNYDTIYTERYMRTPEENPEGYDKFSAVQLASNLKGKLLLLHGMVDDNVHPTNSWQLVEALQTRNIPFEMMFFPNADHGIFSPAVEGVKWSFLLDHLGIRKPGA